MSMHRYNALRVIFMTTLVVDSISAIFLLCVTLLRFTLGCDIRWTVVHDGAREYQWAP